MNFDTAAMANRTLPRRSKQLIAETVAHTTRCPECFDVTGQITSSPVGTEGEVLEGLRVDAALRGGAAEAHFSPRLPSHKGSHERTYVRRVFKAVLEGHV